MHRPNAYALVLGVVAASLVLAPRQGVGEAGPILAPPSQRLTDLLPQKLLDEIEAPSAPVRVAARPTLDWRPGLKSESEKLTPKPAEQETGRSRPTPDLKPVAEPPTLVAPKRDAPAEAADPVETDLLPLKAPRNEPVRKTPAAKAEPTPEPNTIEIPPKQATPIEPPAAKKVEEPAEPEPKPKPEPKKPANEADEQPAKPRVAKPPAKPPAPLSRGLRNLRSRMRTVLSFYYRKPLNTAEHDPWEIMHSMLSYELHSRVRDGGPNGPYMTAVGHLCFNRPSARQQMMRVRGGRIDTQIGVGLQGHPGQFLAMLAQCNVSPDYPIRLGRDEFTIRDLIESEQKTCQPNTELTFKLIGLGHYLDSDAHWLSDAGERWDIPRLIKEERAQPIRGAACGGTHRLAGLSLAFRRREARGEPIDGEYAEAARFVSQYQSYAFRLQNEDGSLSTEWFRGRGAEEDIDRRLRTTGHLLEWLVYSLPDDQLRSHRTVRAASYLTNLLATNADHEWHLGSIAHGLHALVLYDKRVFQPHDASAGEQIAAIDPTGRLFRDYPIYRGVMRNSPPERQGFFGGLFGGGNASRGAGSRSSGAASRRR